MAIIGTRTNPSMYSMQQVCTWVLSCCGGGGVCSRRCPSLPQLSAQWRKSDSHDESDCLAIRRNLCGTGQ
eukprot:3142857-Amphidinium_carterae.3